MDLELHYSKCLSIKQADRAVSYFKAITIPVLILWDSIKVIPKQKLHFPILHIYGEREFAQWDSSFFVQYLML